MDEKSGLGGLISRAGWYPSQALPEQQREHSAFPKDFKALLSLRSSHKSRGTCPLSPQLLLSRTQRLEGLQEGAAPQGKLDGLFPKEAQGDVLREASRRLPVFEGTKPVYTMTYLQQPVSSGTLLLLKLCLSQALSLEQQKGGWQHRGPIASITTGNVGSGQGNDLSAVYAPGTNVWPAQALSSSYFFC